MKTLLANIRNLSANEINAAGLNLPYTFLSPQPKYMLGVTKPMLRFVVLLMALLGNVAEADSVIPAYGPAKSPAMESVLSNLRQSRAIERIAKSLSNGLRLDSPITLTTTECGAVNAFYTSTNKSITLCLELLVKTMNASLSDKGSLDVESRERLAAGAVSFVLLHELGHALIHTLDLPVLGREEDAADQISTFLLLEGPEQDAQFAVAGAMWLFGAQQTTFTRRELSGEHSLDQQRRANLACWAIGKDPSSYAWVRKSGTLSAERELRCRGEYRLLESTARRLLANNLVRKR